MFSACKAIPLLHLHALLRKHRPPNQNLENNDYLEMMWKEVSMTVKSSPVASACNDSLLIVCALIDDLVGNRCNGSSDFGRLIARLLLDHTSLLPRFVQGLLSAVDVRETPLSCSSVRCL